MTNDEEKVLSLIKELETMRTAGKPKKPAQPLQSEKQHELLKKILQMTPSSKMLATRKQLIHRFNSLDIAQKATVLLALIDSRVSKDFKMKLPIKPYLEVLYLRFLTLFQKVLKSPAEHEEFPEIKEYVTQNPKLKRIGCGKFFNNFYEHVKNLLELIQNDENDFMPVK
ncbi:MAG: hypothetical protein ACXQS8_06970 [Candidatus Helarchaeales archaeon]